MIHLIELNCFLFFLFFNVSLKNWIHVRMRRFDRNSSALSKTETSVGRVKNPMGSKNLDKRKNCYPQNTYETRGLILWKVDHRIWSRNVRWYAMISSGPIYTLKFGLAYSRPPGAIMVRGQIIVCSRTRGNLRILVHPRIGFFGHDCLRPTENEWRNQI